MARVCVLARYDRVVLLFERADVLISYRGSRLELPRALGVIGSLHITVALSLHIAIRPAKVVLGDSPYEPCEVFPQLQGLSLLDKVRQAILHG